MKEQRFFYCPDLEAGILPGEEAQHAMRVLRLSPGDEINLTDGRGTFAHAVITAASGHRCAFSVRSRSETVPEWRGHIHIAMAPTKNMDRTEWLAEKATEIGIDRLSMLSCQFSERRAVKPERIERILVSAMKQSHKTRIPQLDDMHSFAAFISQPSLPPLRFIAHCYEMDDVGGGEKPLLSDILLSAPRPVSALVLIGPEGDFSVDEVRAAHACGFRSVSLGTSRLRTETAALVAVHLMRLAAT